MSGAMRSELDTPLQLHAREETPRPCERCNHRAYGREFLRDERGDVKMICAGCGGEVNPRSDAA